MNKIAFVYGDWSCAGRPFTEDDPLTLDYKRGLTGSENSFFTWAAIFAEVAEVHIFMPFEGAGPFFLAGKSNVKYHPLEGLKSVQTEKFDVAFAWNEPDYLAFFDGDHTVRILNQQLNDFGYCNQGWTKCLDAIFFPSATHQLHMVETYLENEPNLFYGVMENGYWHGFGRSISCAAEVKDRNDVCYLSSPDRGLHWVLSMWDRIHRARPESKLHVGYGALEWAAKNEVYIGHPDPLWSALGERASFIANWERKYRWTERKDVIFHTDKSVRNVSNILRRSKILLYPCDPVRYTEGFSVTTAEAASLGCVPVVSNVDSLGGVYPGVAYMPRPTKENQDFWVQRVMDLFSNEELYQKFQKRCKDVVEPYSYPNIKDHVFEQVSYLHGMKSKQKVEK